jgi:hypothetical protein
MRNRTLRPTANGYKTPPLATPSTPSEGHWLRVSTRRPRADKVQINGVGTHRRRRRGGGRGALSSGFEARVRLKGEQTPIIQKVMHYASPTEKFPRLETLIGEFCFPCALSRVDIIPLSVGPPSQQTPPLEVIP